MWAHNPKVAGSNLARATTRIQGLGDEPNPFFVGWRKGVVQRPQRSPFRACALGRIRVSPPLPVEPAAIRLQKCGTIPVRYVRDELGISLEEHLGRRMPQLLRDPLRVLARGPHERRKGIPGLVHRAAPKAGPPQRRIPDAPPHRGAGGAYPHHPLP
jgi:hypothetical protein